MELESDGSAPLSLVPGVFAQTDWRGDTDFWTIVGRVGVTGIGPRLLAAILRLLARRRTRDQLYASLSQFPRPDVDGALDKLIAAGVVIADFAPAARAFHTAALSLPTPAHFLSGDDVPALQADHDDNMFCATDDSVVSLPKEPSERVGDLWEIARARRTVRRFDSRPIDLPDLADILTFGGGATDTDDSKSSLLPPHRTTPSGGALYPIRLYVAALRVNNLCLALYRYHPLSQKLELIRTDISPRSLSLAMHTDGQPSIETCAAVLLLTWSWTRSLWKYGDQGYFVGLLEAGHIAQNALLAATRLGLAAAPTVGLGGDATDAILGLNPREEQAVYAIILGHPPVAAESR